MGLGAICHTLNPRLFLADLEYIVNHAEDKVLMLDLDLAALIAKLRPKLPTVQHLIVLTDRQHMHKVVSITQKLIIYPRNDLVAGTLHVRYLCQSCNPKAWHVKVLVACLMGVCDRLSERVLIGPTGCRKRQGYRTACATRTCWNQSGSIWVDSSG